MNFCTPRSHSSVFHSSVLIFDMHTVPMTQVPCCDAHWSHPLLLCRKPEGKKRLDPSHPYWYSFIHFSHFSALHSHSLSSMSTALECSFGNPKIIHFKPSKTIVSPPEPSTSYVCAKTRMVLSKSTAIACLSCGRRFASEHVNDMSPILQVMIRQDVPSSHVLFLNSSLFSTPFHCSQTIFKPLDFLFLSLDWD